MADLRITNDDRGGSLRTFLLVVAGLLGVALLITRKPTVEVTVPPGAAPQVFVQPAPVEVQPAPQAAPAPVVASSSPETTMPAPVPVVDPPVTRQETPAATCGPDERAVQANGTETLYELADRLNNLVKTLRAKNAALASIGTWERVPTHDTNGQSLTICAGPDIGDRAHRTAAPTPTTGAPAPAPVATAAPVTQAPATTQMTSAPTPTAPRTSSSPTTPPAPAATAPKPGVKPIVPTTPPSTPKQQPVPGTNPPLTTATTTTSPRARI